MLELWLLRHGETDWNSAHRWQGQTDVPLNAAGMKQAGRVAHRLRAERFDAVYSSDLGRARMTALLAYPHGTPIFDMRLRELSFGKLEGKRWDDMTQVERRVVETWWNDPYADCLPDGESYKQLEERLVEWRSTLPKAGRFLVVTHGGPIRSLLWEIMGVPRNRSWTVLLDNCSLTRLSYHEERATVVTVNDCAHLDDNVVMLEGEAEPRAGKS
ncbi:MAG: histidine phosphatase family protein [Proteobacteria bacterium]|nr:histidine phosphatase family protein [Pseudomonadota bacterium]